MYPKLPPGGEPHVTRYQQFLESRRSRTLPKSAPIHRHYILPFALSGERTRSYADEQTLILLMRVSDYESLGCTTRS
jgi:hypothetical protein